MNIIYIVVGVSLVLGIWKAFSLVENTSSNSGVIVLRHSLFLKLLIVILAFSFCYIGYIFDNKSIVPISLINYNIIIMVITTFILYLIQTYKIEIDSTGIIKKTILGNKKINWDTIVIVKYHDKLKSISVQNNQTKISVSEYLVGYNLFLKLLNDKGFEITE